jgi:DNA-directed RNA polymerase specialized sigma24 family protein
MRRILINRARKETVRRASGLVQPEELHESRIESQAPPVELLAVHEVLEGLATVDTNAAELVKLRYFVGMTLPEVAETLGFRCARRNDSGLSAAPGCATPSKGHAEDLGKSWRV